MVQGQELQFHHPNDGSDDVSIHCKQLSETEELQEGDTVSYDTEHDDRKGKDRSFNCTVTSSGGGGGGGLSGVDVAAPQSHQEIEGTVHLTTQGRPAYEALLAVAFVRSFAARGR